MYTSINSKLFLFCTIMHLSLLGSNNLNSVIPLQFKGEELMYKIGRFETNIILLKHEK
jgi:hypothetical protein